MVLFGDVPRGLVYLVDEATSPKQQQAAAA